jgi:hypothetical protein
MWPSASPLQVYVSALSAPGATISRWKCALQKSRAQAYLEAKMSEVEKYIF